MHHAKNTVRNMYAEAQEVENESQRKDLVAHALRSEGEPRLQAMVRLAASEMPLQVEAARLDAEPLLLNVKNGTLDLRTGTLRPHDQLDLITRLAPVRWDRAADCPRWKAFLDHVLAADKELVQFVQRAVGYSLTGETSERSLFVLHGDGANGKTTFLETLAAALGDYAVRTPTETLLAKRLEAIPNDVARLKGARFVTASEAGEGVQLAEARVKEFTGRDTLTARFLYHEWFEFVPEFKLWLATNHKPVIHGTDKAIWDRIRLVPFHVRIPKAKRDRHLLEKLRAELPGILRWAVDGCLAWQRHGLGHSRAVKSATSDYRAEMDSFAAFLVARCILDPGARVQSSSLWDAYRQWTDNRDLRWPLSRKEFASRLHARGCASGKGGNGIRIWRGIALRD
jgi:putative DNA primase/helicase